MTNRINICQVAPDGYHYFHAHDDVAKLLECSARSLGFDATIEHTQLDPSAALNIVLGWQLLAPVNAAMLAKPGVVLYQFEQLSARDGWWTTARERLLRSAWRLWDYARENVDFLAGLGVKAEHVPLGYHWAREVIPHLPEDARDIDVLFYGSVNERRAAIFSDLIRRGVRFVHFNGLYGEERDGWIARSKIVLNLHFYECQIQEQDRLAYLLNNGRFVVSERSLNETLSVGSVPYGALVDTCMEMLSNPAARERIAARCHIDFMERHRMVDNLRRALAGLGVPCSA